MVSENKKDHSYRGADLKLFFRDVRDRQGKKRSFTVRSWATVKDVKDTIQQMVQVPPNAQRLYFGPLLTSGKELPNRRSLHDCGIYRSGETLLLDIKRSVENSSSSSAAFGYSMSSLRSESNDICISSSMIDSTPRALRHEVQIARRAFALGLKPELVLDGSGGTYFLHDARKSKVAVFKPADEEPYAENNPRGYLPQPGQPDSLRKGIAPGEACIREVAAFMLDHDGFSSVPMTTLAEARHPAFNSNGARLKVSEGGASIGSHSIAAPNSSSPGSAATSNNKKVGSFQEFIHCECTMDDISPSMLSADEVHKIAILDIRLMNADRNAANLLCRRRTDDSFELVPIDHGYCLRSVCDVSWMDWCWLDWPQLKQPLSAKSKQYIKQLDIESDARILEERLNISQEAIDHFRASSALLKAGVKAGLTLHQIAVMCCRNDNQAVEPALLERLTAMASELAKIAVVNDQWHHTTASRALVEELSPKRNSKNNLISRDRSSASRFQRCNSSAEFMSVSSDTVEDEPEAVSVVEAAVVSELTRALAEQQPSSPAMLQSSASDSSSDTGDDKEEVEEWAHNIIEDSFVSFQVDNAPGRTGRRSSSIGSDDASSDSNLSSSPGFWHVRPGASTTTPDSFSDDDDDGSMSWSPCISPRTLLDDDDDDLDEGPDLPMPQPEQQECSPPKRRQSVKFAEDPPTKFGTVAAHGAFLPPGTVQVAPVRSLPAAGGIVEPPLSHVQRQDSGGMPRSKSYSALSRTLSSGGDSYSKEDTSPRALTKHHGAASTLDQEHYRMYFLKFIDLVIVREMTRVSTMNSTTRSSSS